METAIILLQGIGLLLLLLIFRRLRARRRDKSQDKSPASRPPAYYDTAGRARRYEGGGSRASEGARDRSREGLQPVDQTLLHSGVYDSDDGDTRRSGACTPVSSHSSGDSYSSGGYSGGDSGGSDGGGGGGE